MKIIALVATSLALFSAAATAQDVKPNTKTVKVIKGSATTLYSIPEDELKAEEGYVVTSSGGVIYDSKSGEAQCAGEVTIQVGKSLKIYATKATVNLEADQPFILLQSIGSIESIARSRIEGEHKAFQFLMEGTRIELPKD